MIELPPDAPRWNRAHRGAFRKGMTARETDQPITASPYADKRNAHGRLTWSRAFDCAWCDGWRWADEAIKQQNITSFYTDGCHHGRRPSTWIR